jgi:hypothetical protein
MAGEEGKGDLPSDELRKALGKASDRTKEEIEEIFTDVYRKVTGVSDYQPFIPPAPSIG